MIETILIAVENQRERMQPVIDHAAEMAAGLDADVVLYHVYEDEEFQSLLEARNIESADPDELARQNATVEAAAATLRESGVDFSVGASTGDPSDELLGYIASSDIDHVFVGSRRRSRTGKAIFGSVSQQILFETDVPCTLV
ncbi:universal stress protein [Halorientalis pallida]|uniref:Universal stress protein n=1 Tax=Halorientalis pallida TaxID=2479928 RepID=A0A498KW36_9EURY|nr:universal stress protein [Halorientalis pallida]RXK47929.1 universal stress protein [Halorientalis pallida]